MVSVESTGALERRLEVSVPADEVERAITGRLRSVGRTARLKGFRPGKAPPAVIERQFGAQVRNEVINEVIQNSLGSALAEQGLSPVGSPRVEINGIGAGVDLKFAAIFEVYPTIEIKGLDAIEITVPQAEVGEADVDAMIENLRQQRPVYTPATEPAVSGDRVTVDFVGRLDGVAFEGGTGNGITLVLGSGRMLPDFEAGLIGVSTGQTKEVPVSFPAEYGKAELAGKTADFSMVVKSVEHSELPALDAAFCEAFGVSDGGVEELRREVTENMRRELKEAIRNRTKTQLLDQLYAANALELPQAAIESQIRALQIDWLRRIGAKPQDLKEAPPREPFEEAAKRRVTLGLLMSAVLREAGITLDEARLEERIELAAMGYGDPEEAVRQIRGNDEARTQIEAGVLEDQAVDWLAGRVKTIAQASTFKEIMNFGA